MALVLIRALFEAEPAHDPAHIAVAFRGAPERVDNLAVEQAEVARVNGHVHLGHARHKPVKDLCGEFFEKCLALAGQALAVHDLVALLPALEHAGDHLGRVLQVRVDDDDRIAPGHVHAGGDGDLVAEVARKVDELQARVRLAERAQDGQGAVPAPIVDKYDFIVHGHAVQHAAQALCRLRDDLLFIVYGYDDGKQRVVLAHGSSSPLHSPPVADRSRTGRIWLCTSDSVRTVTGM